MVTLYHRTTEDIASLIVVDGFGDGEGYYGTEYLHSGVWLSDRPLEADEGALGNALLRVELNIGDQEVSPFEWIDTAIGEKSTPSVAATKSRNPRPLRHTISGQSTDRPYEHFEVEEFFGAGLSTDGDKNAEFMKP